MNFNYINHILSKESCITEIKKLDAFLIIMLCGIHSRITDCPNNANAADSTLMKINLQRGEHPIRRPFMSLWMNKDKLNKLTISGFASLATSVLFTLSITGLSYHAINFIWLMLLIALLSALVSLFVKFKKWYFYIFIGSVSALICCTSILFLAVSNI